MIAGVDALGHPDPAALHAAGMRFVCQYLKNVSRPIIDSYLAHGIAVVLIWETTGKRALGGEQSGMADAYACEARLRELGAPAGQVVYFAEDDLDVTPAQVHLCVAYAQGLAKVMTANRVGWYGGLVALRAVMSSGYARYGWQTYAWSGGVWDPRAHLQQYLNGQRLAGTGVDYDRAIFPDYGAWTPKETDMPLTAADAPIIKAAVIDALNDAAVLNLIARYVWTSAGGAAAGTPSFTNQLLEEIGKLVTGVDPVKVEAAIAAALAKGLTAAGQALE